MTMPLANHIANSGASGTASQRWRKVSARIAWCALLPPERGRDLVGARRAEIDLVLVARIGERRINPVGHVAHPEGDARVLDLGYAEIAPGNVDEGEQV